jgi:hypothetical protein
MSMLRDVAGVSLLTVPELAALLRVPVSRVYEWSRAIGPDSIPSYRAGKRIVFERDEAVEWFFKTQRRDGMSARARGNQSLLTPHRRRRVN